MICSGNRRGYSTLQNIYSTLQYFRGFLNWFWRILEDRWGWGGGPGRSVLTFLAYPNALICRAQSKADWMFSPRGFFGWFDWLDDFTKRTGWMDFLRGLVGWILWEFWLIGLVGWIFWADFLAEGIGWMNFLREDSCKVFFGKIGKVSNGIGFDEAFFWVDSWSK